jgi:PLP dependent protein
LAAQRARLDTACRAAGRSAAEVTLIAVTKTYPAADVARLASLGVLDIGENRDQEASMKAREVAASGVDVRWHFIGTLQRNKCRSVARYAHMVHSVDGVRLVGALADAARRVRDRPLPVLVQASIDGDPARGGALDTPNDGDRNLWRVVDAVSAAPDVLRLGGLMAVAPLGWDPAPAYERLAGLGERLRADHPHATVLSAGMSGDLEEAVAAGATHVRVGSAILGIRPSRAVT